MLAFAVNALLTPVYLIIFGPLGGILLLGGLGVLAIAALFMTLYAVMMALKRERPFISIVGYAVLSVFVMAISVLFLLYPLAELSHTIIYGPRPTMG